jgi:two-component system, cell cycle sensor histidine kinase and response regulator CckA
VQTIVIQPSAPDGRQRAIRYLLGLGVTAAAIIVTALLQVFVAPFVVPPFLLAIVIAAAFAGRGPGLLTTVLSLGALNYWYSPPFGLDTPVQVARQALFLILGGSIVWVSAIVNRQRWLAVQHLTTNERLRLEAEAAARKAAEAAASAETASRLAAEEAVKAEEATAEAEMAAQDAAEALEKQLVAEHALRQREAELADFFENASTPLHWVGAGGTILRVNQAELDMLGYERNEYVGRHIADFHVDRPVIDDILSRLLRGEVVRDSPARLRCKDGGIKDVVIDSSAYSVDGEFVHTRCFTRDVTVEKRAHEAIARLAAIVSSSSDAIVGKTLDGVVTSWNAAAERTFGYSAEEMVGQPIFRLIPEHLHDEEREILAQLREGRPVEAFESERIRKDGSRIWISLSVSPVRDASGSIIGAASIKRDITERKVMAEHLRETQRLQAVGQLAGGMAHEANNQMSVVLGGAHFLLRRPDLAPAARQDVELIRQAAERTASITQQLLTFSRRQVLELQDVNLDGIVTAMEPVLRRSLRESHQLVLRLALGDGLVRADPRQLEQVLLNLVLNARDAMPDGGRVTIDTREVNLAGGTAGEWGRVPRGHYAALFVEDTGSGMDPETLQRVFDPFFTTQEVGVGTGLGLSVVHGIVNQIGGYVAVQSEPGMGSTFKLYVPIAGGGHPADEPPDEAPAPASDGRVALLVEDDPLVRAMAVRGLAEAGYVVLEATNGRAALDLLRGHAGTLDIVITDIGMPEMGGEELGRRLRVDRPHVPVLYMSGYGDANNATPLLRKPFDPDTLVNMVSELLQAGNRRA